MIASSALLAGLPEGLRSELIAAYAEIVTNYVERRWKPSELASTFPIHQLHGERDPFLPAKLSQADLIVPKAGHLLTKTHAEEVNRFIAERIAD